jgi:hypothetical protein
VRLSFSHKGLSTGRILGLPAAHVLLISLLSLLFGGCSGDAEDIQTFSYSVDYSNTDQRARQLATFLVPGTPDDIPSLGVYPIGNTHVLVEFSQRAGVDLSLITDYDFLSRDYFIVLDDGNRCGELLRREAVVRNDRFIYSAEYRFDIDLVCLAVVVTEGFLFDVETASVRPGG